MLIEILRFELRQQLRSPLFWLIAVAFGALAFAVAGSDAITIGGGIGNVHRNAPSVVIELLTVFTVLGMFLITVFVAGAALRDFDAGTADLFFATPMSRTSYLGGRFAAGWLAAVGVMLAVALGLMAGVWMPWVDPDRLGPTRLDAYAWAFGVIVLPNLFFIAAILFLLATLTRSMLKTYIGVIAFFVLWQVAMVASRTLDHRELGALVDPFAARAVGLVTQYWTAEDRNTRVPGLGGLLLANRVLWGTIALALLGTSFALFRADREGVRWWKRKHPRAAAGADEATSAIPLSVPTTIPRTDARARAWQWLHLAWFDTRGVIGSVTFLVMLAFGLMNLGGSLAFGNEMFGTKVYPVTHLMTTVMDGAYNWLLVIIVAFYAGELVWRERAQRVSAVVDAFPLPDWIPLLSKLAALAAVIVLFLLGGIVTCMAYQLAVGGVPLEPWLYLSNLALNTLGFLLLAALALFFQSIANNKFLGYLFVLLYFVSRIALGQLHFDHHLYNYGSAPEAPYSDMNGYGHFLPAQLWFRTYWGLFAIALLVLAALYWSRGTTEGWMSRMRTARQRFGLPSRMVLAASLLAFAAVGVFLFRQTTVLNRYVPGDVAKEQRADYERKYRQYLGLAQPRITDVRIDMDLFPHQRKVDVRGHYLLRNKGTQPITDLHVRVPPELTMVEATFAPHEVVSNDAVHGYTIYRLQEPLAPGASMPFDFVLRYWSRGIRNAPDDTRVVDNGTFVSSEAFPHFGYDENGQLADRNDRRKHGLPQLPRMPKIDDEAARGFNLLGRDADWVNFEATVSTEPDQVAIAPGYLQREWTEGGRRHFHYVMDKPILDFFSFQSARYEVRRDQWNGVAIEVYHDAKHAWNVDRMIDSAKKSLAHFSAAYSPYQFRQLRIVEFPGYESFAQSFANTVPFSESIGFIADLRDPDDIDYVFYVTAHEVAHQWWAHQVIPAFAQGATMIVESFAQYSALMVQEQEYGPAQMRKFLKYELDRYLSGRGGETVEELPLALNENQPYIHYRKGSVVMYALKDYLGEDAVDRTLARYVGEQAFRPPPYTTTRDFLADLREEAGATRESLVSDLFEKITVFDNRVTAARATRRADGRYDVTLDVHAAKAHVDGVGKETPAAIDQPIDIGVFARAPDGKERNQKVLFLEKRAIADGDSTITVTVDGEPSEAGIDPYNKLVDRVSGDNRRRVSLE